MLVTIRLDDRFRDEKVPSSYSGELTNTLQICFDVAHELLIRMERVGFELYEVKGEIENYGLLLRKKLNGTGAPRYMQDLVLDYKDIGFNNEQDKMIVLATIHMDN